MPVSAERRVELRRSSRAEARDIGPIPGPKKPDSVKRCEFNLKLFLETYLAARFPLAWSEDHLRLIADIQAVILGGGLKALAMPRGSGKTSILEGAAIWAIVYAHRRYLMIVAATGKAAALIMENIRSELAYNDDLLDDFPGACFPIRALGGVSRRAEAQSSEGQPTQLVWTRQQVRLPCTAAGGGAAIAAAGITGSFRGSKCSMADGSQVRPDLVLVDDFQTRESAASPQQTATRLQTLRSDVLGLAGPGKKVACLCACTIIYRHDGAAQLLDRKAHPEWQGMTAKLMRSMPGKAAMVLWEQYAEIILRDLADDSIETPQKGARATEFYRSKRSAMDAGADAAWTERKSEGEISAVQHAMNLLYTRGEEAFYAEYQNDPIDLDASEIQQLEASTIAARINRIPPGFVPQAATELVSFIDVGEGCLWWGVGAFAEGFRGDLVSYGAWPNPGRAHFSKSDMRGALARAYPLGTIQATWTAALNDLCARILDAEWPDESGVGRRVSLLLIDAGDGDATDTVFEFCNRSAWRDRLLPSRGKGIGAKSRPMADWPKEKGDKPGTDWRIRTNKARKKREVQIGVNFWKTFTAARLQAPLGGPGCFSFAGGSPAAHALIADHCTAEKSQRVTASGRTVEEWSNRPGRDNDLWDVVVGLHVAASMRGISLASGILPPQESRARLSFAEQQRRAREKRTA